MKFSIGTKIFLGNVPLFVVIILITTVALIRLGDVQERFTGIVEQDIAQRNVAERMRSVLRDRELKAMQYLILVSRESYEAYRIRSEKFVQLADSLGSFDSGGLFAELVEQEEEYQNAFARCSTVRDTAQMSEFTISQADSIRSTIYGKTGELLSDIIGYAREQQNNHATLVMHLVQSTVPLLLWVALVGGVVALVITFGISSGLLKSVHVLQQASMAVSEGLFRNLPTVHTRDELGELSHSFNRMAHRLISLEETYKDASPLTGLPGGLAIETMAKQRIDTGEPFAFCMIDLDNFKPFNDRYGYSRGNMVIKQSAKIITEVADYLGDERDFVGHIGGDDFVLITMPDRLELLCSSIISRFDQEILQFYDDEDCQEGRIISTSRKGNTQEFPIMTISIAAVNSNYTPVESYIYLGEIVAELKKYAKGFRGSNFVVDRRSDQDGEE